MSDVFTTAYFGAKLAEIEPGDTVAIFGCGPVGQCAIASAKLLGAEQVIAVDTIPSRLEMARRQGAEVIDYNAADPVETIVEMTGGLGAHRVIDAVGVDANRPHSGPAAPKADQMEQEFQKQMKMVAPRNKEEADNWHQGDAPSIVTHWSVESIAKGGTLSIIGVYPQTALFFPIGLAMEKQLKINSRTATIVSTYLNWCA